MTDTNSNTVIGTDDETPRSEGTSTATGEEQDFSASTQTVYDSSGLNLQKRLEDDVRLQERGRNCYTSMRQSIKRLADTIIIFM